MREVAHLNSNVMDVARMFPKDRGWEESDFGDWMKDGVNLSTVDGALKDPAAHWGLLAAEHIQFLSMAAKTATPRERQLMAAAYNAGATITEWVAQAQRLEKIGRPKVASVTEQRNQALAAIMHSHPELKGKDIWERVPKALRPPSTKAEANILAAFRKQYFPSRERG